MNIFNKILVRISTIMLITNLLISCKISSNDANDPPIANAGTNLSLARNSIVTLDGSNSSDPDGDLLTYQWSFVSVPNGNQVTLSSTTSVNPSFTAEVSGEYVLNLIVSDGETQSNVDEVRVTVVNTLPVANAGIDTNFPRDSIVTLNGGGSNDTDSDTLSYQWSFASIPAGSQATLSDTTSVAPSFTADILGEYVLNLIVNDGEDQSNIDEVRIKANSITLYSNDFSSNSLDDFIIGGTGSSTVFVENGHLRIKPDSYPHTGYVALNLPSIYSNFKSKLSENNAKVIFMFNVSNLDTQICGACNNLFFMGISTNPDSVFGYKLTGGGLVGNRMTFAPSLRNDLIFDISNGLSTLPSIGAFKISYESGTNLWEFYFDQSVENIDPTTLTRLIGATPNDDYVNEALPYFILGSQSGDSAFFDNLTIALEFDL